MRPFDDISREIHEQADGPAGPSKIIAEAIQDGLLHELSRDDAILYAMAKFFYLKGLSEKTK